MDYKTAWIKNGFRLVRAEREIRRGKNKGKLEIAYKKGSRIRKAILEKNAIRSHGESYA